MRLRRNVYYARTGRVTTNPSREGAASTPSSDCEVQVAAFSSSAGVELRTASTRQSAPIPAATPDAASSTTMQSAGAKPSSSAPRRYGSGSGLPRAKKGDDIARGNAVRQFEVLRVGDAVDGRRAPPAAHRRSKGADEHAIQIKQEALRLYLQQCCRGHRQPSSTNCSAALSMRDTAACEVDSQ